MKRSICLILVIVFLFVRASAELLEDNGVYPDQTTDGSYLTNMDDYAAWVFSLDSKEAAGEALNPNCQSAFLMEAETGKILYEKNPDEKLPIASVTKVMTLLLVMEALDNHVIKMEDMVTVSEYAASMGGSQAWMEPNEQLSVHEMIKSVVVSSCNDGAVALAEHITGSESAFVALMNKRAQDLGMVNTDFVNCTGLDDREVHHSTARDVALMTRELLKHKKIMEYTKIWMDTIRNGEFGLSNTNKLIRFYPGANGMKTGSTSKARYCLSATAERNGMQLIAVTLASATSADRFSAAKSLLDFGFANYALYTPDIEPPAPVRVWGGKEKYVECKYVNPAMLVSKGQETKITARIEVCAELSAPVDKDQKIGSILYELEGKQIGETPIFAAENVEKKGYFDIVKDLLLKFFFIR